MGEKAKRVAKYYNKLKEPLKYRVQDGSQASRESLPPQQNQPEPPLLKKILGWFATSIAI